MSYVVGFVAAVPTENREAYRRHVEDAAAVFKEHGALQVVECWGDDVPEGKVTSFPMAVKCKPDETVVFAWITWPSREARDAGMAKVRADPRMAARRQPSAIRHGTHDPWRIRGHRRPLTAGATGEVGGNPASQRKRR